MSPSMLIIPDAHASPLWDNERFDWLGRFVVERQPGIVLCLGDFADMPSLSSYDKGKGTFEGRRYKADLEATWDAQRRLFAPLALYNQARRRSSKRQYKPRTIMVKGNHEDRITRAANDHPELDGTLQEEDLKYEQYWDEVYPFKSTTDVQGFSVSHYFASGTMGRPIGGKNIAATTLGHTLRSSIFGHSHVLDFAERTGADGSKAVSICAGCYTHPDFKEGWCANVVHMWWQGVIVLHGAKDGYYDGVELVRQDTLRRWYA